MTTPPDSAITDATADALMNATLDVLAQHGLKGATTRAIAARAGVNEVTLFRKYGNKTALIRAAIQHRSGRVQQSAVQYTGNLEADLTHFAQQYQQALSTVGPVIRVMITEFPKHPELRDVLDGPRQLFAGMAALLGRYQQQGQLRPEPMTTLIPAFLGPLLLPQVVPDITALLMQEEVPPIAPEKHVQHFLYGRTLKKGTTTPEGNP